MLIFTKDYGHSLGVTEPLKLSSFCTALLILQLFCLLYIHFCVDLASIVEFITINVMLFLYLGWRIIV